MKGKENHIEIFTAALPGRWDDWGNTGWLCFKRNGKVNASGNRYLLFFAARKAVWKGFGKISSARIIRSMGGKYKEA
jgi:hypothetical protein